MIYLVNMFRAEATVLILVTQPKRDPTASATVRRTVGKQQLVINQLSLVYVTDNQPCY